MKRVVVRLCPYDPNHKVLGKRFQYHIIRCAKVRRRSSPHCSFLSIRRFQANPHIRRVKCSFNATHLTTPEEIFKHMSTCPDNQAVHDAIAVGMADFSSFSMMTKKLHDKHTSFQIGAHQRLKRENDKSLPRSMAKIGIGKPMLDTYSTKKNYGN